MNKDSSLCVGAVLFVGIAFFGFANWLCYMTPTRPIYSNDVPVHVVQARQEEQSRDWDKYEERAKEATIPFVFAVPLTFIGLAGAIINVVWLINRNVMETNLRR